MEGKERVTQVYSAFAGHFSRPLREKFDLVKIKNRNKPCLFYGQYGNQIEKALNHNAKAIILWAGSDLPRVLKNEDYLKQLKQATHITHIARSNFLANDLERAGLPYKKIPVVPHRNNDIEPCPLGDIVYCYKRKHHGGTLLKQLMNDFPEFEYIDAKHNTYPREELIEIYKRCFVSFRFTRHDGLSNTAIELGLMGRYIFWNGDTPNAIPWENDYEKIKNKFLEIIEAKKSGTYNPYEIAKKTRAYLDIDDSWLYV